MKKTAFFTALLFLFCPVFTACSQTAREGDTGLLKGDEFSLETSLSYTLSVDGETEMFSSYESKLSVYGEAEHIARTISYYGLPMDEEYTYIDGVYYYKSFDQTKISAELSTDEYETRRADLLFLPLCDSALYQNRVEKDGGLTFDGATEQMEQYLKSCLGIGSEAVFSSLEIGGTLQDGQGAEVAVTGEYSFWGQKKSFVVEFTAKRDAWEEKKSIAAPADADTYLRIGNLTEVMSINAAYSGLFRLSDFTLQDETKFALSYAGVALQVEDSHTYRQTVEGDAFTMNDSVQRTVKQGENEKTMTHTVQYADGILEEAYDGVVSQQSEIGISDMIADSRSYYNAASPVGEYLENIEKQTGDESTVYTYAYSASLLDDVFSQYITSLYDNMEGYLEKATEKQYAQRTGALTLDENGVLLAQEISFDATYKIDGRELHCTLSRILSREKNDSASHEGAQ